MTEGPSGARARVEPPPEGRAWTLLHLLRWSTQYLSEREVPEARLQVEWLLAHTLGVGRLDLYLQYDRPLHQEELDRFRPLLLRRARREPLQYITGRAAFRSLDLRVDPRALIPRPETEGLVEEVLRWARARPTPPRSLLEVGTGSGAIALSLWTEVDPPLERLVATDLSAEALELARENAERVGAVGGGPGAHPAVVEWRQGPGLGPVAPGETFDVLVSNPPYVGWCERGELDPEVEAHEPHLALFGGEDGLDVVRTLVQEGGRVLEPGGLLALEIGAGQGEAAAALARSAGSWSEIRVGRDLSGRDRYLLAASRPQGRTGS